MSQYTQYNEDNQYGGGGYEEQQRGAPSGYGNVPRPMVDPEAEGEVDLNL